MRAAGAPPIAASVDPLTVSRRLGHGSPTIAAGIFGDLFAKTDDPAGRVMEATFCRSG